MLSNYIIEPAFGLVWVIHTLIEPANQRDDQSVARTMSSAVHCWNAPKDERSTAKLRAPHRHWAANLRTIFLSPL